MVNLACTFAYILHASFFLDLVLKWVARTPCIMLTSHGSTIYRNKSIVNIIMKTFAILLVLVLIVALGNCTDPSENEIGVNRSK